VVPAPVLSLNIVDGDGNLVAGDGAVHAKGSGQLVERGNVLDRRREGQVLLKQRLVLDVGGAGRRVEEHDLARVGPRRHRNGGVQTVEALAARQKKGGTVGECPCLHLVLFPPGNTQLAQAEHPRTCRRSPTTPP